MKKPHRLLAAAITAAVSATATPMASAQQSWVEALQTGTIDLHLRARYENVDQEGVENADALTLKTRLTYTSSTFNGFNLLLEMDDVTALTDVDYNDGTGINPAAATISDPEGTEVNQAYLAYQNLDTTFKYGRQRILLDNQRFVGGVGWRQNEQTFDAFSATHTGLEDTQLFYAYVHNANRLFGERTPAGDHQQQTHLLNGRYSGWHAGALVGYAYLIDNEAAPALSSDSFGARWEGHVNDNLAYNLEYARQTDGGDNPTSYTANYLLVEAVAKYAPAEFEPVTFKLGYEILGSDNGEAAFTTPLATLHAFQGWTDKFLATPAQGVEDLYVSAGMLLGGVNLSVVYHDLSANHGDMRYGSELGFTAGRKVGPVALLFKFADYGADEFATDTRKYWLQAAATF